jgi:hypothetical protein
MPTAAREVLVDCALALEMLEEIEDLRRWRVLWAGSVALLRAVGHVLKEVDGADPRVGLAVDARYRIWLSEREENAIFWDFIEEERNNVLKEYQFGMSLDEEIPLLLHLDNPNGETEGGVFQLGENLYRPLLSGYSAGEDARDVYRVALDWWEREITTIEDLLQSC